jgi:TRAP-type mannitol/chloroaromatic compound transport system permease large subunit
MEAQREVGNFAPDPVSVGDLFAGALIPGVGLAFLYMVYQFVIGIVRPQDCPPMARDADEEISLPALLASLLPPVLLIVVVLGSILAGAATPTEAAGVGALGALLLAGRRLSHEISGAAWARRLVGLAILAAFVLTVLRSAADLRLSAENLSGFDQTAIALALAASAMLLAGVLAALWILARAATLTETMMSTMRVSTLAFAILIGATIFSLIFRSLGGDEIVTRAMEAIPGGPTGALIAVLALVFVLGFFLDFIEIVFIIMPIVAPVILQSDINPIWFGVLIALNLQTSFLTPPFGFALFYLRGVAPPEVRTIDIYRGVVPYILIQVAALATVFLFPALATWLPSVLFR